MTRISYWILVFKSKWKSNPKMEWDCSHSNIGHLWFLLNHLNYIKYTRMGPCKKKDYSTGTEKTSGAKYNSIIRRIKEETRMSTSWTSVKLKVTNRIYAALISSILCSILSLCSKSVMSMLTRSWSDTWIKNFIWSHPFLINCAVYCGNPKFNNHSLTDPGWRSFAYDWA